MRGPGRRGAEAVIGAAAVVLGIIALTHPAPIGPTLVAMLCVGAALLIGSMRMFLGTALGLATFVAAVVWSSDPAFITESAPHKSHELKESVVTRTVTHFKGDSLVGQYELRPTSFTGHSLTGHFAAARKT